MSEDLRNTGSIQETIPGDQVNVSFKPLDQLPPISDMSLEGDPFWRRRKLRPDTGGGNFHNIPVLNFGIDYEGDQAVLRVPTRSYMNSVVEEYNPGGFTFVESDANEDKLFGTADEFLGKVSNKQFPASNDTRLRVFGIPDIYRNFLASKKIEPYVFRQEPNISLAEHDMVDHGGLAAIPATEVDTIAEGASLLMRLDKPFKDKAAGRLDRYLDKLSEYATISADNDADAEYREYVWEAIEEEVRLLGVKLKELDPRSIAFHAANTELRKSTKQWAFHPERRQRRKEFWQAEKEYRAALREDIYEDTFRLDREKIDQKAREMQAIGSDGPAPVERSLGSAAMAA